MIAKIEFYQEMCCEICCSIIHNHFDCPACGQKYAGTSIYREYYEELTKVGDVFSCEDCDTEFRLTEKTDAWKWEFEYQVDTKA